MHPPLSEASPARFPSPFLLALLPVACRDHLDRGPGPQRGTAQELQGGYPPEAGRNRTSLAPAKGEPIGAGVREGSRVRAAIPIFLTVFLTDSRAPSTLNPDP